jgi:putative Ig domain-containing protein
MSIGTAYLAATGNTPAGTTTCVANVSHSTTAKDCIAVWITSNTTTSNLSGVTDSQGNTYSARGTLADGTNINGQWYVADISNNPSGPKALTAGTDTITGQYSGTGGTKTVDAIGCSGVAGPTDQSSPLEVGSGTSFSYALTTTNPNELALAGELNSTSGGALTWSGSFTTPAVSNANHPGSAQFSNVAAIVLSTKQTITVSGSLAASANWATSAITLLPVVVATSPCRVGATVPNSALSVPNNCYDAGLSQKAADTQFCTLVQRGIGPQKNHLAITKKFWTTVNDYSLARNDLSNYLSFGTKVIFAVTPPLTGGTTADQNLLANFCSSLIAAGWNASNAVLVLWQEPENNAHFGKSGQAQYQTQMAFFGPIVNASGLPLAQDVGMGASDAVAQNFLNAGYATGVQFAAQYADFYYGAWNGGITLDAVAAIADSHGVPFGVGEFGCHVTDNYAGYLSYLTSFFQARLLAGKKNSDLEYYQGVCSATGAGDLTSPILTNTDPRITYFQTMFDTLTSIPVQNTITVTNPGNQSSSSGSAIAPLNITATDSDPSQTLTFSAVGLPPGLSISAVGSITGTPTTAGTYNVTVTATDSTGATGTTGFTWVINPVITNTVTVTNPGAQSSSLNGVVNLANSATDSNPLLTSFAWGASGLPPGLVISSTSGTITGQPSALGTFSVTISATDSTGSSGSATFNWTIVNPNLLKAGAFTNLSPSAPSIVGGLAPCSNLSYELSFGLVAGAGSTIPFSAVTLQFYDFDALPGLQTPIDTVTFRCPMATNNDPNGAAIITGHGPMRGAFMRVQIHNIDTVDATFTFFQLVGVSRNTDRHAWRWDCGGNAPVIPGYTNATAASSSLVLGGMSALSVPANGSVSRLCSMYAGQVWLRVHLQSASSVDVIVTPQPSSLFSSQASYHETVQKNTEIATIIALPRGPALIQFVNNDAANSASIDAELIAIET